MNRHDATTLAATRDERRAALHAAVAATFAPWTDDNFAWPLEGLAAALDAIEREPAGETVWRVEGGVRPTPYLLVGWASDYAGRRHLRVVADRLPGYRFEPERRRHLGGPPGWSVFAEHAYRRVAVEGDGPATAVLVCACGAAGTVAEIAWMGATCGPCHDRAESGEAVPAGWRLPAGPPEGGRLEAALLTPDGRYLFCGRPAFGYQPRGLRLDLAAGSAVPLPGAAIAVHPSGDQAVVEVERHGVGWHSLWDVAAGQAAAEPFPGRGFVGCGYTPTGSLLALVEGERAEGSGDLLLHGWPEPIPGPPLPLPVAHGPIRPAVSADDRLLAVGQAGVVLLWDRGRPGGPRRLAVPEGLPRSSRLGGQVRPLAFAPDGRRLAGLHAGRSVVLFDLAGEAVRSAPLPGTEQGAGGGLGLAFHPDGDALLAWGPGDRVWVLRLPGLEILAAFDDGKDLHGSLGGEWLATASDGRLKFWPWRPLVEYVRGRERP